MISYHLRLKVVLPPILILATSHIAGVAQPVEAAPQEESSRSSDKGRRPLTPADYGKWESLGQGRGGGGGALSRDGSWLIYPIRRVNEKNELRLHNLKNGTSEVLAEGAGQQFSKDSRWLGYTIRVSAEERRRLEKKKEPVYDDFGLVDLRSGERVVIKKVNSFAFSGDGQFVAIRHYKPRDQENDGADLTVRNLNTGSDLSFGNVSEYQWQDDNARLAMAIDAEDAARNSVQLLNAATGLLKVLDSKEASYRRLSWREEADDLAVFREEENEDYEDSTQAILAWQTLGGAQPASRIFDQTQIPHFPADTRIVSTRPLTWSKNGESVFFSTQPRRKKTVEEKAEDDPPAAEEPGESANEEPPDLQIWHSKDVRIIPEQQQRVEGNRDDAHLAVWHIQTNSYVGLADGLTEITRLQTDVPKILGLDASPYEFDGMFGRSSFDLYSIDIRTGQKSRSLSDVSNIYSISPDGKNVAYLKDDHYTVHNFESGEHRNLTQGISASFVNQAFDHPVEQMPPYGFVGWDKEGKSFLANTKYDVWRLAVDEGSKSQRLTDGEAEKVVHRYVRLDREEDTIDPSRPIHFSLYGEWSKKYGYARLQPGASLTRLVWEEAYVSRLIKAESADVFAYVMEDFDDSPDYFVGHADLSDSKQVSNTNPFQSEYAWGKSELIEYTNEHGRKLQGALFYPANYQTGQKYPMITYIYEILSNTVRRYAVPSQRDYYNHGVFSAEGYFVLRPDIVFDNGDPGISSVRTIERAVGKVIEMGLVDEKRVGLVGHSWGGYQSAFAVTQTDIFAAAVAGAGLTDFFSMYGMVGWAFGGAPENNHFEVGQERMGGPPWKDLEGYIRNSPVMHVDKLNTPLLFEVADNDRNVDWRQGIEYYNAARRAGKQMVMLVYAKEGHGLRQKKNQTDYQRRILEWFGHYLQGEPAPRWIEEGIPFQEQQSMLKNWKQH